MKSSSAIILTALLLALLFGNVSHAALLDKEYNKNGEVYVLVGRSQDAYPPAGIYKTCEYKSDDTGKRDVIVAGPGDLSRTYISSGGGRVDYYGIAVNKDRRCYTFSEEVATAWDAAPPTFKTKVKVVNDAGSRSGWYDGGCAGNERDYLNGGCGAAHYHGGHQTAGIVYWRGFGGSGTITFPMLGTGTFGLRAAFNATGDEIVGAISGKSAVFPCSMFYPGDGTAFGRAASGPKWDGEPWPTALGPTITRTINGKARVVSATNEYLLPVGMWYHNAEDTPHTYYPRAGILYMNLVAKKDHDLKMHQWIPRSEGTPWSSGVSIPPYDHTVSAKAVFQLFETKFHVYAATPCGDGCMAKFDKKTYAAGDSRISITITPFGRSYGLQVVNDQNVKSITVKQADPVYDASGNITAADPVVFEFTSDNWNTAVTGSDGTSKRTLANRLKIVNTGSSLSYTNWNDAKSIATSYKFKSVETGFGDKEEFVYLSDQELFCVSDNWFGTGGTAFWATPAGNEKLITAQTRKESNAGPPEAEEKRYFKVTKNVQDISADGYGNFFFLCTTDLTEIRKMMDDCSSGGSIDFDKIRATLTKRDAAGFAVAENYSDPGTFTPRGPDLLREISFDVIVYKTIYKIGGSLIGEKAEKNPAAAKNIGNPFGATPPETVGRIPIGRMRVMRAAVKSGTAVSWFTPELVILNGGDLSGWPAEIATINIAAPPEEQGVNYYIDLTGPTGGSTGTAMKPTGADADLMRAARCTDTILEGDEHTWSMENAPVFNAITDLNEINGTTDRNGNGIIGGVRNNVIRESMVFHWKVYRLYDVKKLGLPWPVRPGETEADQKAGGDYREALQDERWLMFKDLPGKIPVGQYERVKEKQTNANTMFKKPGFAQVDKPFELSKTFKESGVYKIVLEVIFDYYEYSAIKFGENRGALNGPTYKRSSLDLVQPGYFSATDWQPVFNHTVDTRFVVAVARDAMADGKYIKNVTVGVLEGGNVKRETEVNEVDRSRERKDAAVPAYSKSVAGRRTPLSVAEVDPQRMNDKDVVADFAVKFVSALPDRGDAGNADRELAEKFGGVGVWDYNPDTIGGSANTQHPPNWDPDTGTVSDLKLQVYKVEVAGKPYPTDRKMFIRRNYGMSGHGTLVRALSQAKLDEMQKGMDASDPKQREFMDTIIKVDPSFWNAMNGADYPIREIDWTYVQYQWFISYRVGGKVYVEEPASYKGNVGELLRACGMTNSNRAFIERLGARDWPVPVDGRPKDWFNITDENGFTYTHDNAKMAVFHVRIPMMERISPGVYKRIRWETPIAPEKYRIGVKITAPTVVWKKPDDTFELDPTDPAGKKDLKKKLVHWDLHPGPAAGDSAWCGPTSVAAATEAIVDGKNIGGLPYAAVFVTDREPPRFSYTTKLDSFIYDGATTGDKYTGKEMTFQVVDNNPNCDLTKRDSPNSADEGLGLLFPLNGVPDPDGVGLNLKSGPGGGSSHDTVPYVFGSGGTKVIGEGKCFDFPLTDTEEMWGASYARGEFLLPVAPGGGPVTEEALGAASTTTTPFMPPDYDGNLYYSIKFKFAPSVISALKIPADAQALTIPDEYKPNCYFKVEDNDPPQLMIDVLTSFTEVDRFGVAVTDKPGADLYDFGTKTFKLNEYRSSMSGNSPGNWPPALVDRLGGAFMKWGESKLDVLASAAASGKFTATRGGTVEVSTLRALTPFRIYIPEKSRAVFAIRAVDNVQKDGEYRISLYDQAKNEIKNMTVAVESAGDAGLTPAMLAFKTDLQYAPSVTDGWVVNALGIFRIPMNDDDPDGVMRVAVADAAGNKQQIDLPVRVVNTYFKQEKLDMENRRIDPAAPAPPSAAPEPGK